MDSIVTIKKGPKRSLPMADVSFNPLPHTLSGALRSAGLEVAQWE